MSLRIIALAVTAIGLSTGASAQQLEWKQVSNLPKGLNLPQGVKADIQGIELGMSYPDAKAVLQGIAGAPKVPVTTEKNVWGRFAQPQATNGVDEAIETISLPVAGGLALSAEYVGEMNFRRLPPGTTRLAIEEYMTVRLSAPSSGYQVYYVDRLLTYREPKDQPLISELLAAVKQKFGDAVAEQGSSASGNVYTWLFSKGTGLAGTVVSTCGITVMEKQLDSNLINRMNTNRKCDVILTISVTYGISKNHASVLKFELNDVERTKENALTDLFFFDSYVKGVQQTTHGAPPKL